MLKYLKEKINTGAIFTWGIMLFIMLPPIIWGIIMRSRPVWWQWFLLDSLVVAITLALTWKKPSRGYLMALLAWLVGTVVINIVSLQAWYGAWVQTLPLDLMILMRQQFGPIVLRLLPTLLLALTLIGSGLKQHDLFLIKGNLNADVEKDWLFRRNQYWKSLAVIFLIIFTVGLTLFLALGSHINKSNTPQVITSLPFILIAAALNAFIEEYMFRSVLLARLNSGSG